MKNYFFKFLKKSFLTGAILALFFVNSFSFLTYADDTLFSIEGMNMSQYGGGSSGDLEAILTRLAERGLLGGGGGGTGGSGGGNGGGDGTTFEYSERIYAEQDNNMGNYIDQLTNQMNLLLGNSSYSNVTNIDLNNDGVDEIIATKDGKLLIFAFNGIFYIQTDWYKFGNTEISGTRQLQNIYFLRIEDESGKSVYYLLRFNYYSCNSGGCARTATTNYVNNNGEILAGGSGGRGSMDSAYEMYGHDEGKFSNRLGTIHLPANTTIYPFFWSGDGTHYRYYNGSMYFANKLGVLEKYVDKGSSNKTGGYTTYRFKKDKIVGGNNFAVATYEESSPFVEGSTIADSEYDRFLTKQNSDGTYNYKITLEKPDGSQIVAFYGLNYNGIIFKDLNGDGVKDIITYENYKSEDNVEFKRMYVFQFNPDTYKFDKVLDGVDSLTYQWYDADHDGMLDLLIRRYDEKLYMYKNNNVESYFTNLGSIRGTYFNFIQFGNDTYILTKNKANNGVVGEWKLYSITGDGFFNATQNYSNGLIGTNYKVFDIDGSTNKLLGIQKEENKYKVVYLNKVNGLIEDFDGTFYINDLTSSYIINGQNGNVAFLTKDSNYVSFYKNNEDGKKYNTLIYRLPNGITLRAVNTSSAGDDTIYFGETYYIIGTKSDIISKIDGGIDIGHIVTTKVTDMSELFKNNTSFNDAGIRTWDMVNVSNISNMFNGATSFNQNMSHITLFGGMNNVYETNYRNNASAWINSNNFKFNNIYYADNKVTKKCPTSLADGTYKFNGVDQYVISTKAQILEYIGGEDVSKSNNIITSKVTDMSGLFYCGGLASLSSDRRKCRGGSTRRTPNCSNRSIPNNTMGGSGRSRVRGNGTGTICILLSFNGNISSWDTSNVTTMENMFRQNHCFNQDISKWDTSKVTNMNYMFSQENSINSIFSGNISGWNVSKVGTNHTGFTCNGCSQPTWSS